MSERRQLALLLAGLIVLVAVGVAGATLFPEGCVDFERVGDLDLVLTDAAAALPLSDEDGDAVEQLADELGIGQWRGAVELPDEARVAPSDFGFFVVTDTAFTVLRPSFGIASAARGRAGLDVIPAGTSLALRAADGEVGVFDGEYELERCGRLPVGTEVLALDRGVAVLADGREVVGVTLSGGGLFRAPAMTAAHVTGDTVVLGQDDVLELRDVGDGAVLDRLEEAPGPDTEPWLHAAADRLLLRAEGGVVPVAVRADAFERDEQVDLPLAPGSLRAAVITPTGIVALGRAGDHDGTQAAALATDRSPRPVTLPAPMAVTALHASADGHVGVVVEVDGTRALLLYGRDIEG